jgi:hypothetical protein
MTTKVAKVAECLLNLGGCTSKDVQKNVGFLPTQQLWVLCKGGHAFKVVNSKGTWFEITQIGMEKFNLCTGQVDEMDAVETAAIDGLADLLKTSKKYKDALVKIRVVINEVLGE